MLGMQGADLLEGKMQHDLVNAPFAGGIHGILLHFPRAGRLQTYSWIATDMSKPAFYLGMEN